MFCPHCNSNIPNGSNICPLCYGNIAGTKPQTAREQVHPDADVPADEQPKKAAAKPRAKKPAYTKGSRPSKKSADRTPMIIAFGLILILVVIIAMIVRSMFGAGDASNPGSAAGSSTGVQQGSQTTKQTPDMNLIVFGATATPQPYTQVTPTPAIEVTPSPTPQAEKTYTTLRKGDEGPEVVTLQQALRELGYLSGAADGNFGTGTMTAVKKFQEDNDLDADGIAGKLTQEALFKQSSVTPMPETTVGPGDILDLPG